MPGLEALFNIGNVLLSAAKETFRFVVRTVAEELASAAKPYASTIDSILGKGRRVNEEMEDLKRKKAKDGDLSGTDRERAQQLAKEREAIFDEYQATKAHSTAQELKAHPDDFRATEITPDTTNLLQYHMGPAVLKKNCDCGWPMVLQHRNVAEPGFNDFFWQCSRYYANDNRPKCKNAPFVATDLSLLHKAGIPEIEVPNKDLQLIAEQKPVQQSVIGRIGEHLNQEDAEVLCPVHMVPMVLRQKRAHNGHILDMYFLACSHMANDAQLRCGHTVKLKSYPQLAAYLRRVEGTGILH